MTNGNDTTGEATTEATIDIKPITDFPIQKSNTPERPANIWESPSPKD